MSAWTERLAQALDVDPLDAQQEAALLRVSRDIAHRVERKETPLSAYLLGVAAGSRIATGSAPGEALEAVTSALRDALPPQPLEGA